MLLAVDIGNTNMEFGIFDNSKLCANFRLVTDRDVTSDEIGLMMTQFFDIQNIRRDQINDIIIASVVPQVMFSVNNAMRKYIGKKPLVVGENCEIPIKNLYANPKEVGADRLVDATMAYKKYDGPTIIVDFGTATTFDVISENGEYIGGCIFPGIKISMEALNVRAARLPRVEITKPEKVIGLDTVSSMQSGAVYGFVGATEYTIEAIKSELKSPAHVVATGGISSLIANSTNSIDIVDKRLTLEGLCYIFESNKKK